MPEIRLRRLRLTAMRGSQSWQQPRFKSAFIGGQVIVWGELSGLGRTCYFAKASGGEKALPDS